MKAIVPSLSVIVATMGLLPGSANADHRRHIDELAASLSRHAAAAAREVYYHFRSTPQFRHLYRDVYEMYRLSEHIHDMAHAGGSLAHVAEDVEQLDELFHHAEEVFGQIARRADQHGHSGWHGGHGFGHGGVSEYQVKRLSRLLASMGDTLHHLQEEVNPPGVKGPGPVVEPPLPPGNVGPSLPGFGNPGPVGRRGGRSVTFGNGKGLNFTVYLKR